MMTSDLADYELDTIRRMVQRVNETSAAVRTTTDELRSKVVECIQQIELHDSRNKKNQYYGKSFATGTSIGTLLAGGVNVIAPFTSVGMVAAGWRAKQKTMAQWNAAKAVLDIHHRRRLEFIDAYLNLYEVRDQLCYAYPYLKGFSIKALTETRLHSHNNSVSRPSSSDCSNDVAVQVELMVSICKVLTVASWTLALSTGLAAGLALEGAKEAAKEGLVLLFENLPIVSIVFSIAHCSEAAWALDTPSQEAMELRAIYEESMRNLDILGAFLDEYRV